MKQVSQLAVAGTVKGSSIPARNRLKTLPTSIFTLKKTSTFWSKCRQGFKPVSSWYKKNIYRSDHRVSHWPTPPYMEGCPTYLSLQGSCQVGNDLVLVCNAPLVRGSEVCHPLCFTVSLIHCMCIPSTCKRFIRSMNTNLHTYCRK